MCGQDAIPNLAVKGLTEVLLTEWPQLRQDLLEASGGVGSWEAPLGAFACLLLLTVGLLLPVPSAWLRLRLASRHARELCKLVGGC